MCACSSVLRVFLVNTGHSNIRGTTLVSDINTHEAPVNELNSQCQYIAAAICSVIKCEFVSGTVLAGPGYP